MQAFKPLQEKAYDYLRQLIADGKLEYDVFYSETKIASEIGISRTPVKDALVRLSQDRYIDIIPSKGFCLHRMTAEDVMHTYQARIAIEGFCALELHRKRGERKAQETIRGMQVSVDSMAEAIRHQEPLETVMAHDLRFHSLLVKSAENPELMSLFEAYNHRLYDIAMQSFRARDTRPLEALSEHRRIMEAILAEKDGKTSGAGDFRVYEEVIRHMDASREISLRLMDA